MTGVQTCALPISIERAAYRLKKKQQDAMFEPWRDVAQPLDGDIREQAQALVRHIEEQYTEEVLETLIRASGLDESRGFNN